MKTLRHLTIVATLLSLGSFVLADDPPLPPKGPAQSSPPTAATAKPVSEVAEKAAKQLEQARQRLLQQSSISANLTETIAVQPRTIRGTGRYVQGSLNRKGEGWRLRSELKIRIGSTEGHQLEVCEGEILWSRMEIRTVGRAQAGSAKPSDSAKEPAHKEGSGGELKTESQDKPVIVLTRRNVAQIMEAASKRPELPSEAVLAELGLGGMPALLASFQQALQFDKITSETMNGRAVTILEGTWSDVQFAKWRITPKEVATFGFAAPFVPDRVQLVLDEESGFPHRIVFYKKLRDRNASTPLITLEYSDLRINQPIDPSEFVFVPSNETQPMDVTVHYLERLKPVPQQPGGIPGVPGNPAAPAGTGAKTP